MKKYSHQSRLAVYSQWIDTLLVNTAFVISFAIHNPGQDINDAHLILLLTLNLVWVALTHFLRVYKLSRLEFSTSELVKRFAGAVVLFVLVITALLYFTKYGAHISRLMLAQAMAIFLLNGCVVRWLISLWLKAYRSSGHNLSGFMTVGNSELGDFLRERYAQRPDLGFKYLGTFEFDKQQTAPELARLEQVIEDQNPDFVYCCMNSLQPEQIQAIISIGERQPVQIRLVPDFRGFLSHHAAMEYHDVIPVIEVSTKIFNNARDETLKRLFDLSFSVTVMLAGLPVFLAVVLAQMLTTSGPVFFRQERTGRWGRRFKIYKFRTMRTDADKMGLQHSKGNDDPRITPLGRHLRRTRLDELPQFINVLRGEMSVVGPRPLYAYDVDMLMDADPDHFKKLLTVKPGITSVGQLRVGYADNLNLNLARMKHDLEYLRKYSMLYDLRLIALTMFVMLSGRGR